jgi:glycosyltransferase involved in cell wall biosynthesis
MNEITVVIPTFNRRKLLQNAIDSVLKETRVPIKVHIFDNAYTDDTEHYVRTAAALDPRIFYFKNDYNCGAVENFARGLASVSTTYYVPLADDDWLLPNFLFDAFHILEEYRDAGAAIFVTEQRNEEGNIETTYPSALDKIQFGLLKPSEHLRDWMTYGHYAWSSILWRSETLKCIGAPYFHVGLPSDVDFQVQIFCDFSVYIVNRPGAVYRAHAEQASRGFDMSHLQSWALLFKRLDRKVKNRRIIECREYLKLREIMQRRYQWAWNSPSRFPLTDRQIIAIATSAGLRLGDWDLAFSLLDQLKPLEFKMEIMRFYLKAVRAYCSLARRIRTW